MAHTRPLNPALQLYRSRRQKREDAAFEARIVDHSYAGLTLRVAIRDSLGEGWYDHDWGVQAELDLLSERGRLGSGALVFDIGAHHGVVALMYADRSDGGHVVAVEAGPYHVAVARENASLNPTLSVLVEHAAIAASPGTVWFDEGQSGVVAVGGRRGRSPIPAVTIDELADRHGMPDVVAIDVEGFEGRALEGAARVLEAGKTDFFVEIHNSDMLGQHGWTSRGIVAALRDRGADVWIAPAYDGEEPGAFARVDDAAVDWAQRLYCVALFPPD